MIKAIMEAVSIPVMAKVRIGHTVEAQILQVVGVDYIDVSGASPAFIKFRYLPSPICSPLPSPSPPYSPYSLTHSVILSGNSTDELDGN